MSFRAVAELVAFRAAHLACLRVGATTNPLMPIFRERDLSFMLGLAESKIIIRCSTDTLHLQGHHALSGGEVGAGAFLSSRPPA
ncbi:hypothetical protein AOQ71_00510 [Bradyrhizobium manausense]|uniref:Uncharacterized protein n=1 Tax=Bradyrhizobium manausense TaxID=989370 RepID=A0A0R3ECM3_9BRAD|nr:hypothetical protein AOQ71_00510 [Bradyrhizobium manausense]